MLLWQRLLKILVSRMVTIRKHEVLARALLLRVKKMRSRLIPIYRVLKIVENVHVWPRSKIHHLRLCKLILFVIWESRWFLIQKLRCVVSIRAVIYIFRKMLSSENIWIFFGLWILHHRLLRFGIKRVSQVRISTKIELILPGTSISIFLKSRKLILTLISEIYVAKPFAHLDIISDFVFLAVLIFWRNVWSKSWFIQIDG